MFEFIADTEGDWGRRFADRDEHFGGEDGYSTAYLALF